MYKETHRNTVVYVCVWVLPIWPGGPWIPGNPSGPYAVGPSGPGSPLSPKNYRRSTLTYILHYSNTQWSDCNQTWSSVNFTAKFSMSLNWRLLKGS